MVGKPYLGIISGLPVIRERAHRSLTSGGRMTRSAVFPCHMYLFFPRSLLPFGVVKEGEQLGIDLVFQGRAHAVRPAGNDLELGAFQKLGGR